MANKIEKTILSNLIHNEEYCRKVVPFIKSEYFLNRIERVVSEEVVQFFNTYNKQPTLDILAIQIAKRNDVHKNQHKEVEDYLNSLDFITERSDWLLENTESFCKQRAVYNAIIDSFEIIEGKHKTKTEDAIPSMLSDALAVSFNTSVGNCICCS